MSLNRNICIMVLVTGLIAVIIGKSFGALCVWRKPDEDIAKFYPGAKKYVTEFKKLNSERQKGIESRLGVKLDRDETEFKFFRILKGEARVGTILTHLGKGEYGAIEVVVALDREGKVIGVKIQRDRERKRKELRGEKFLGQFKRKTVKDFQQIGNEIGHYKGIKLIEGAERSAAVVAFSVYKMLVVYDFLG